MDPSAEKSFRSQKVWLIIIFALAGFFLLGAFIPSWFNSYLQNPRRVIVRVGAERIYNQDLTKETESYPDPDKKKIRQFLLAKLVTDSIILQAGAKNGFISLQKNIFNSSDKNYTLRLQAVAKVKKEITSHIDSVEGTAVAMFFINGSPGPLGYQKAWDIVKNKITSLYNRVKTKQITIEQASAEIKNDNSLFQIDKAYKTNASFDFQATKEKPATRVDALNAELWNLPEGAFSKLYLGYGLNPQNNKAVPSYYIFAKVKKRVQSKIPSFDTWLSKERKNYAVFFY